MAERPQTYKNHVRYFPLFHFFVFPVLLVNVINEGRHLFQAPSLHTIWTFVFAVALTGLALAARTMALTVQDRVIRLEMRQRLALCLPTGLQGRIVELTPAQLVALRFAGNAEMAELAGEVLDGRLTDARAIKRRVKDWQGDRLRA